MKIVPHVFKFVFHVLNLIFLKNNLKLYPPFSILWIEQKNKKNKQTTCRETQTKNREERQKKKTTCREQTTNPPKMHHTTNWTKSQIHTQRTNTQTLKFVFSKFIFFSPISFSKWEINACVDDDDNAAIWTSHKAMEVSKYVYVREREIRGVEKWGWWDEWWREQCGFYGNTNHEKREWEIVIEILEDKEEDGEEKIIWG